MLKPRNTPNTRKNPHWRFGFRVVRVFRGFMSWIDQPIFFVDFEGSRVSGILEYGVVTLLRGEIVEARTRLCAATGRVRAEDTEVHGLTAEGLAQHRPFADDWESFAG